MDKYEYTVWVGGDEVNDYYLTKDEAEALAQKYRNSDYTDVFVERVEGEK